MNIFEQVDTYVLEHPVLAESLKVWDGIVPVYEKTMRILETYEQAKYQPRYTLSSTTQTTHKTSDRLL